MDREEPPADKTMQAGWLAIAPAWLFSCAAHLVLFICGSLIVRGSMRTEIPDDAARAGEIVLARRDVNETRYFDASGDRHEVLRPVTEGGGVASALGIAVSDPPPVLPGIKLPELAGSVPIGEGIITAPQIGSGGGPVRLPGSAAAEAAILAEDALVPREKIPTGPTAQLSLFGSQSATGRSFVFVIDRSNSMGGDGLGAIQAAAKELAARIDQLSAEQTFQVVAYNESVAYLTGRELIPASNENKRKLVNFIANLAAFGQTEHSRGLLSALRMKPEVVFLLTDGGDPPLDPGQLRTIREAAAGRTEIHCVHFGRGPSSERGKFLMRLAGENRGSYVYIDMNLR
jgi:hypothetical protein